MNRARVCVAAAMLAGAAATLDAQSFEPLRRDGNGLPGLRAIVAVALDDVTVARAVQSVADLGKLSVTFDPTLAGLASRVTLRADAIPVAEALLRLTGGTSLLVKVSASGQIVIVRGTAPGERASLGAVAGVVLDSLTGEPLADARVELVGTRYSTLTRGDGRYAIRDVPAGSHALRALRIGYLPGAARAVTVVAGEETPLGNTRLERGAVALAAVRVAPGQFGVMEQSIGTAQTLSREQIETNPQLGEDVFRAVNRLPGLSANDLSAKFYVRGGSGDELYVTLDGVQLYEPFHLKDADAALSIVDVEAIGGLDLSTGGFGAEYGDRLTGVFSMRSLEPRTGRPRTAIGLSITNLRLLSQGGFSSGKGAWLVSARRGYIDVALRLTNASDSLSPRYYDVLGKVQYDLSPSHRVAAHVLVAGDRLHYLNTGDPNIDSRYGSNYAWLTWSAAFGQRLRAETVASMSRLTWNRVGDQLDDAGAPFVHVNDDRSFDALALKQDWTLSFSDRAVVRWGAEVKQLAADYNYLSRVQHATLDTTLVREAPRGMALAAYASQRVRLGAVVAEGGVRVDRQTYGVGETEVSPRLSAAWTPFAGTTLRGAWGRYFQAQGIHEMQAMDGVNRFYPAELAEHRVVGVEQEFTAGVSGRVELYDRLLSRQRPRYENVFTGVSTFPEVNVDRVRIDALSGDARGAELFVKRVGARVDWSASYALARVRDDIDGGVRSRASDQRHSVYLDASYRAPSGRWRISAGWLYHSGWPFTPVSFRFDTLVNTPTQLSLRVTPEPQAFYSAGLPSYQRFDVRATRYFDVRGTRIALFADIFNLLDRKNARGYGYSVLNNPVRIVRQIDAQVPRLPTAGITVEF
ncbi:MAG: TonB-dependent receptor [Gemmatimonadaceae bacterium]